MDKSIFEQMNLNEETIVLLENSLDVFHGIVEGYHRVLGSGVVCQMSGLRCLCL